MITQPLELVLQSIVIFEGGIAMNWDQIQGNWKEFKGKLREKWGKLTDDDMDQIAGARDQLAGKLQRAYGYGKEQAEKEIELFCTNCKK